MVFNGCLRVIFLHYIFIFFEDFSLHLNDLDAEGDNDDNNFFMMANVLLSSSANNGVSDNNQCLNYGNNFLQHLKKLSTGAGVCTIRNVC